MLPTPSQRLRRNSDPRQAAYRTSLGHMPSFTSFTSSNSVFFCARIWTPFRSVPFFESRSSIVMVDRERRLRCERVSVPAARCDYRSKHTPPPSTTLSTCIVMCFLDMVLSEMASWPADDGNRKLGSLRVACQTIGRAGIRSAAVRPKRYSFPGRSQSFRPVEERVSILRGFGAAWRGLRGPRKRGRTLEQITLKQPHGFRAESIDAARTLNARCVG